MSTDLDERDKFDPSTNPVQDNYERTFGNQEKSSSDSTANQDIPYTADADRNSLADSEMTGGMKQSVTDAAKAELQSQPGVKSAKNRFASLFMGSKRSRIKKRVAIGLFSSLGAGTFVLILLLMFMMASGFGVKHLAIVAKNFGFYRLNRLSHSAMVRLVEGDVRVKSKNGLSAVTPSSTLDKIKNGFDIEKVLKNLEDDNALKYIRDGDGNITHILFNDSEEIAIDGLKRNPFARADAYNSLSDAIRKYSPELAETSSLVGKTSDGILERVGIDRLRWSERVLAKHRSKKTPKEALGVEQIEQIDNVVQEPEKIDLGDSKINAAREAADEHVRPTADKGIARPVVEVVPEQIDAVESSSRLLSRNAVGQFVEGASAVMIYSLCTVNAVNESAKVNLRQSDSASKRMATQLLSAGDQVEKGATTAAAIGATRKTFDDFNNQANVQKAYFNADWKQYRQLPDLDGPQPRNDRGWLKTFATIAAGANTAWDTARAFFGGTFIPENDALPQSWSFTTLCAKINSPVGSVAFGLISGIVEQMALNAIWPGGASGAGNVGKEAAEGFMRRLINTVAEKGISSAIREALTNVIEGTSKKVSDLTIKKIVESFFKRGVPMALEASATIGMTYLIIKLADGAGGHTYTGTSDQDYGNKSIAGLDVLEADLIRTRMHGVPITDEQNVFYQKQQYAEYLKEQHSKSFAQRFFDTQNPYSVGSKLAMGVPYDLQSTKTIAMAKLNPFSVFESSKNTVSFLAKRFVDQQKVYAESADTSDVSEHNGVQQWDFTPEEEELMKQEEYSLESISNWGDTPSGKQAIKEFDARYGACYSTKNQMADILLNEDKSGLFSSDGPGDSLKKRCLNDLPGKNQSDPNVFKWRLYRMDNTTVDETIDIQEISESTNPTTNPNDPNDSGEVESGEITSDSSSTPCANGTDDLGIRDDAYTKGQRIKIRICAVNSIPGSSDESRGEVPGANGRAIVSSIASDSWQRLGEAAKAAGIRLSAGSSWRTMQHQVKLCNKNPSCKDGTSYNAVAKPGTSNHQAGTAIDISQIYNALPTINGSKAASGRTCSNPQTANNPTYLWMVANASKFGVKNYPNEAWHWGTSEAC